MPIILWPEIFLKVTISDLHYKYSQIYGIQSMFYIIVI